MTRPPEDHLLVVVHVTDRVKQATRVQDVLTRYGACIKTRLGLHEPSGRTASRSGIIVLEMVGPPARRLGIVGDLQRIGGVEAKSVSFAH